MEYHWPGNVRELQNILKRMLVLGDSEKIVAELYETTSHAPAVGPIPQPGQQGQTLNTFLPFSGDDLANNNFSLKSVRKKAIDRIEKEVISHVLEKTDWNRSKASKILKVSYKTLLNKIAELNILPPAGKNIID
jgi:DNA-binding NtrC family response regulator